MGCRRLQNHPVFWQEGSAHVSQVARTLAGVIRETPAFADFSELSTVHDDQHDAQSLCPVLPYVLAA